MSAPLQFSSTTPAMVSRTTTTTMIIACPDLLLDWRSCATCTKEVKECKAVGKKGEREKCSYNGGESFIVAFLVPVQMVLLLLIIIMSMISSIEVRRMCGLLILTLDHGSCPEEVTVSTFECCCCCCEVRSKESSNDRSRAGTSTMREIELTAASELERTRRLENSLGKTVSLIEPTPSSSLPYLKSFTFVSDLCFRSTDHQSGEARDQHRGLGTEI